MTSQQAQNSWSRVLVHLLFSGMSATAGAAQPYVTDDAAILDKGACQFEIGKQVNRGNNELWMLPACNFTGNLELTLGKSQFNEAGSSRSLYVLQGKGLFSGAVESPHAWGWVAGVRGHHQTAEDRRQLSGVYGSLLYTYEVYRDLLSVNVNVGARSDRDDRRDSTTWGTSAEYRINSRFTVIGEFFGDDRTRASHQLGLRAALVPDRVEFDVSYGAENGSRSDTHWWTIGLRFVQMGLF